MRRRRSGSGRSRAKGLLLAMVCLAPWPAAACGTLPAISGVLATDERTRTKQAYADEQQLRDFALFAYRNVANDLITGRGAYLDAVTTEFAAACADRPALLEWLRSLLLSSGSATDFSRQLAVAHALATERFKPSPRSPQSPGG